MRASTSDSSSAVRAIRARSMSTRRRRRARTIHVSASTASAASAPARRAIGTTPPSATARGSAWTSFQPSTAIGTAAAICAPPSSAERSPSSLPASLVRKRRAGSLVIRTVPFFPSTMVAPPPRPHWASSSSNSSLTTTTPPLAVPRERNSPGLPLTVPRA